MELWDLFDRERNPLKRTIARGKDLEPGTYHQIIGVWTVHRPSGKILVTQRHYGKEICPGKWENTGGLVLSGETSAHAALRELAEETGIQAEEKDMELIHTLMTEEAFIDSYLCFTDVPLESVRLQENETIAYRWLTLEELAELVKSPTFAFPIIRQYETCLENLCAAVRKIKGE